MRSSLADNLLCSDELTVFRAVQARISRPAPARLFASLGILPVHARRTDAANGAGSAAERFPVASELGVGHPGDNAQVGGVGRSHRVAFCSCWARSDRSTFATSAALRAIQLTRTAWHARNDRIMAGLIELDRHAFASGLAPQWSRSVVTALSGGGRTAVGRSHDIRHHGAMHRPQGQVVH
jgi:hypothetical protein